MQKIKSIQGTGILTAKGERLGPISFELVVYRDNRVIFCDGLINGDPQHLLAAQETGQLSIIRDDHESGIDISFVRRDTDRTAEVEVRGTYPWDT